MRAPGFSRIILKNYKYICVCLLIPVLTLTVTIQWLAVRQKEAEISYDNKHAAQSCLTQLDALWTTVTETGFRMNSDSDALFISRQNDVSLSQTLLSRLSDLEQLLSNLTSASGCMRAIHLYFHTPRYYVSANSAMRPLSDANTTIKTGGDKFNDYRLIKSLILDGTQSAWTTNSIGAPCYFARQNDASGDRACLVVVDSAYVNALLISYLEEKHALAVYADGDAPLLTEGTVDGDARETDKIEKINGGSAQVVRARSGLSGWTLVLRSDESDYDAFVGQKIFECVLMGVTAAALCAVLAYVITLMICRPYTAIADLLNAPYQDAKQRYDAEYAGIDDLGIIRDMIFRTKYQLFAAQNELESRDHLLKDAQAVALQAQINPHFLYNTLESINWKVLSAFGGEHNDISEMICDLSELMRLSIGAKEERIPLREEVEHARTYVKLQLRRFPNRFRVDWALPENALNCLVIPLTLHPLIENAIQHGVKKMTAFGVIRVSGYIDNGALRVCVSDNGPGFTPETLAAFEERRKAGVLRTSEHVGLFNVDQRVRIMFGEDYGVTVASVPFVETRVTMRMPCAVSEP